MSAIADKARALSGDRTCTGRAEELVRSAEFRKEYAARPNVITAEEMPWERSPDGLIKHLINHRMNTPELCVEAYMLFLKAGEHSGKHRHMWGALAFVVEGDLLPHVTVLAGVLAGLEEQHVGLDAELRRV